MNNQCTFCIHADVCAYREHYKEAVELYHKAKEECGKYPYFKCDIVCVKYCKKDRFIDRFQCNTESEVEEKQLRELKPILCRIRKQLIEEKEAAYADFDEYKREVLGVDDIDDLPQDDYRYGLERAIDIIIEYMGKEKSTEKTVNQEKRGRTVHELKISPKYYDEVVYNNKRFVIRKDDRNYQVGDLVTLKEYENGLYTGRQMVNIPIRYILRNAPEYGLKEGYCILGI